MIEPRDIASRVPMCPKCGDRHFTYVMGSGLPLKVKKIRCAQCANILRACRAAQPAPFGLTVGQLDRLALIVGTVLLAVILLRTFFAP
jgi:hypothetical protein